MEIQQTNQTSLPDFVTFNNSTRILQILTSNEDDQGLYYFLAELKATSDNQLLDTLYF